MEKDVKFYTSHCPKCHTLEILLKKNGIEYSEVTDLEEAKAFGLRSAPGLGVNVEKQTSNGLEISYEVLDFNQAVKWINSRGK